jgi:hypothetical protein
MTPKQEKLISLITENCGVKNYSKTLGAMLLEAGYSQESADNPFKILSSETIQEELRPIVDQLEEIRLKAIEALKKKDPSREHYRDVIAGLDTLTKNIQLLSDRPTDIIKNKELELLAQRYVELEEKIKAQNANSEQ